MALKIMMIDNDPAAHAYHLAMINNAGLDQCFVREYLKVETAIKDLQQTIEKGELEELPDVILVDINMPGIDGWSFVNQLKKLPIVVYAPRIYIVSNSLNPIDKMKVQNSTSINDFKQKFLNVDFFKSLPYNLNCPKSN